ncbi:leucine-rich repeat-containing protein 74B-like [Physella acuta]|uniref:leucine-rich repeat-containing protein 74B-like n=1 Tax=Physella acuta TaxID=109671 RepID=UPI0027DB726B|nr:leucine-rich repeat-containing protein 74B-like [Physella acuta]
MEKQKKNRRVLLTQLDDDDNESTTSANGLARSAQNEVITTKAEDSTKNVKFKNSSPKPRIEAEAEVAGSAGDESVSTLHVARGRTDSVSDDSGDEIVDDSDYDTDLDIDGNKWVYPERYDHDLTGKRRYLNECKKLGVHPISYFLDHMQDQRLKLKNHGIGPQAMIALTAPLQVNTTIEHLDLEGNGIRGEGTIHLCRVLRENVFITELNISENGIENEGAEAVCQLLMYNKTIEKLNLAGNGISDGAAQNFYTLLTKRNSTLRYLNLSHNQFEDEGARWFKDALMENEVLEHLDLSWNHFQKRGCVLLAEGLKENVGLKEFSISMNGLELEGGKALGEAIKSNRTLLRLYAANCRLSPTSAVYLANGLMSNDNLNMLDVSENCIIADGAWAMLSGIEKNEASNLMLLNLGSTHVEVRFKKLQEKLRELKGLEVIHGGVLYDYKIEAVTLTPLELFKRDPYTKLRDWVGKSGYRLVDMLRRFDKNQNMTISIEEFWNGIMSCNIPITERQFELLIERMDRDGNGEIDFSELLEEDREHTLALREVNRWIETEKQNEVKQIKEKIFQALK